VLQVNLTGSVVGPEAPISYLRAHQTPPGPASRSYRQPTVSPASRPNSTTGGTTLAGCAGSTGGGYGSSSGGAYGSSVAAAGQDISLPDIGARSHRSTGGVRGGGMVAAAVAAINAKGSPTKGEAADSPRSGAGSSYSASSSYKAAGGVSHGRPTLLQPSSELCAYGGQDTAQDLDSPSKASLDSPNKFAGGAWATPQGAMARGIAAGGAAGGWGGAGSAGITPSRIPSSSFGVMAAAGSAAGPHRGLSLRGGSAAKAASPAAAVGAAAGRQGTLPGAYMASAGVTGRRGASGGGGGGMGSVRGSGGTPSRAEIGLRSARKPAARR
jgi:hypothetical protein